MSEVPKKAKLQRCRDFVVHVNAAIEEIRAGNHDKPQLAAYARVAEERQCSATAVARKYQRYFNQLKAANDPIAAVANHNNTRFDRARPPTAAHSTCAAPRRSTSRCRTTRAR